MHPSLSFAGALIKDSSDRRCLNDTFSSLDDFVKAPGKTAPALLETLRGALRDDFRLRYEQFLLLPRDEQNTTLPKILHAHPEFQVIVPILQIRSLIMDVCDGQRPLPEDITADILILQNKIHQRIKALAQASALQEGRGNRHESGRYISERHSSSRYSTGRFSRPNLHEDPVERPKTHHSSGEATDLVRTLRELGSQRKSLRGSGSSEKMFERRLGRREEIIERLAKTSCSTRDCANILYQLGVLKLGREQSRHFAQQVADDPQTNFGDLSDSVWGLASLEQHPDLALKMIARAGKILREFLERRDRISTIGNMNCRQLASLLHSAGIFEAPKEMVEPILQAMMINDQHTPAMPSSVIRSFHASVYFSQDRDYWSKRYRDSRSELRQHVSSSPLEQAFLPVAREAFQRSYLPVSVLNNIPLYNFECDIVLVGPEHTTNIEIDGEKVHRNSEYRDAYRDTVLKQLGIDVKRISGRDVSQFMSYSDADKISYLFGLHGVRRQTA